MGQTLDTLETLATTAALHLQHLLHLGGSPQPPPFAVRSLSNSAATRGPVLVAGLGNWTLDPRARHSVGMALLDFWADSEGLTWRRDRALAGLLAGPLDSAGRQVYLLKPALLMNINGQSVARAAQTLGVAASTDIVVAHDDLDRGFGRLSPKAGGSPGGHNGVRSCIAKLGTDRFRRLRIGIGRPSQPRQGVTEFVLASFTPPELDDLASTVFPECIAVLQTMIAADVDGGRS